MLTITVTLCIRNKERDMHIQSVYTWYSINDADKYIIFHEEIKDEKCCRMMSISTCVDYGGVSWLLLSTGVVGWPTAGES